MKINNVQFDNANLSKRNLWPTPSGQLAVRPGMRRVFTPTSGSEIVAAFSLRVPTTDEVIHYVVEFDDNSSTGGISSTTVFVLDDNFDTVQAFLVGATRRPRVVTHAEVLGEILITSPDFPTLVGYSGGGLTFAAPVASDSGQTTEEIPLGLSVSWANRSVISDGAAIWISDTRTVTGGSIQTFVGTNAQWRPGVVYGLHVGAGGSLIACTSVGVYALPESAAAAGQVAIGAWQQLSSHQTTGFSQTGVCAGRLYGLTEVGLRVIDVEGAPEVRISEPEGPRLLGPRISRFDWREANLFAFDDGPCVASGLPGDPFLRMSEEATSWIEPATAGAWGALVGRLKLRDGEEAFATETGVWRSIGDFDGEAAYEAEADVVKGWGIGRIPMPPDLSERGRQVTVGADWSAQDILCALLGVDGSGSGSRGSPKGIVLDGGGTWGDSAPAMIAPTLASRRAQFDASGDEFTFEVGAVVGGTRLAPTTAIGFEGIDRERPIDR